MANLWFCKIGAEQRGPMSAEELRGLARCGEIGPGTPIRRDDMIRWVPAARVRGLLSSGAGEVRAPSAAASPEAMTARATPAWAMPEEPGRGAPVEAASSVKQHRPPRVHPQRAALGLVALAAALTVTGLAIWNGGWTARMACIVAWISLFPMSLVFAGRAQQPLARRSRGWLVALKVAAAIGWLIPLLAAAAGNWFVGLSNVLTGLWDASLDWLHSVGWIRSAVGWIHADGLPGLRIGKARDFPESIFVIMIAEAGAACVLATLGRWMDLGGLARWGWSAGRKGMQVQD